MTSRGIALLAVATVSLSAVSCSGGGSESGSGPESGAEVPPGAAQPAPRDMVLADRLAIVASTSILGDVVTNVAGELASVTVLMEAGENPHSYEPFPAALRAVEDADVVFVNGFNLEENLLDDIRAIATGLFVEVSREITPRALDQNDESEDEHGHEELDPHVWMDPNNAILWVDTIVDTLAAADPAGASAYERNGQRYTLELESVDRSIRQQVATIRTSRRRLVVDHHSFGYFADRYGFEIAATIVPGTSNTSEPSPREIAALVDLLRDTDAETIFVGRTASRGLDQLARTVSAEVDRPIRIVPTLTGALAPPGEPGDTYIGLLEYNTRQIVEGLTR